MAKCHWCGEILRFVQGKGYVHEGGGAYLQYCDNCGWSGSFTVPTFRCPKCGGDLRDDHCALPVEED